MNRKKEKMMQQQQQRTRKQQQTTISRPLPTTMMTTIKRPKRQQQHHHHHHHVSLLSSTTLLLFVMLLSSHPTTISCFQSTIQTQTARRSIHRRSSSKQQQQQQQQQPRRISSYYPRRNHDLLFATPAAAENDVDASSSSLSSNSSNNNKVGGGGVLKYTNLRDVERQIVKYGRIGQTSKALELYESIDKPTVRLVNGVIDACSRARPPKLELAFQIFETAVNKYKIKPNVFTFGSLMNVCSRSKHSNTALKLLETMQSQHNITPNVVVYSSAITACARSTPPQHITALHLLKEAVETKNLDMSVVGFNAAISACARAEDWKSAISILERMEDAYEAEHSGSAMSPKFKIPKPDSVTYGTVLAACEYGEQWGLVLSKAKTMQDRGLPLDGLAVTSCLHACQQLGLATEALDYLERMKNFSSSSEPKYSTGKLHRFGAKSPLMGPDPVAYRLAISACARGGEWKDGIRLLNEFEDVTGIPPDVVAYTSAITGCEYAGMWKESFYLLDKMRKQGVEPNEVTMAAVLGACATACAKLGFTACNSNEELPSSEMEVPEPQQKALELLRILKKSPNLVSPNVQVYNSAIRACAESGNLKQALQLLQDIEDDGLDRTIITYGCLMTACERVGCVESASKVFRKMRGDGIEPNEIIYGAAISCCRKAKQPERAYRLLQKMMKEGLTPNAATFNTVLVAQAEGRTTADSERAILVYKIMKSKFAGEKGKPNRQTYTILINFFASIKQPITAEQFLIKMRQDSDMKPDVDLCTATVTAYEKTGQPLKALQLMESMQADGYDFYGVAVLNTAFKNAVKLVNRVGKSLSSVDDEEKRMKEKKSLKLMSDEDEEYNNNENDSTQ